MKTGSASKGVIKRRLCSSRANSVYAALRWFQTIGSEIEFASSHLANDYCRGLTSIAYTRMNSKAHDRRFKNAPIVQVESNWFKNQAAGCVATPELWMMERPASQPAASIQLLGL
jgi:hypothetical protein